MIYALIIIFAVYFILVLAVLAGWNMAVTRQTTDTSRTPTRLVSVIVAFRNEETNLPGLINSLRQQDYKLFEVILVNDHSSDAGHTIIGNETIHDERFRVILNEGIGKKEAISSGISAAKGDIVVVTDADCAMSNRWISCIAEAFERKETKFVFGLVETSSSGSLFDEIQALEFASVVGMGAALSAFNIAAYCNGANMAFTREAFLDVNGYDGNDAIASGDDQFLMQKIWQRSPGSVVFIGRPEAVVSTKPCITIRELFQQRLRWASKWRANESLATKLIALFMVMVQIAALASVFLAIAYPPLSHTAVFLLAAKAVLEFVLLFNISNHQGRRRSLMAFVVLQIIYPFYVLAVGISANFVSLTWKGRQIVSKGLAARQM